MLSQNKTPEMMKNSLILYSLYLLSFFFGLRTALTTYIDSSFLTQIGGAKLTNFVFIFSSIILVICFLGIYKFLNKLGNYKLTFWLLILQVITLIGLTLFKNPYLVVVFFILTYIFLSLSGFSIDMLLESYSKNKTTGKLRGLYLTMINAGWIVAPIFAGTLVVGDDYTRIYTGSVFILMIILWILQRNFSTFVDPKYVQINVLETIKEFFRNKDLKLIMIVALILNMFYGWMTIYTPIYLNSIIGFSWQQIGFIFTFMLLPFILIEYPLGKFSDRKWGEKEMMAIGAVIMTVSTLVLAFTKSTDMWVWAIILFMTRVGASMMEVMIETYFFKKINGCDSNLLSIFRTARPASYLISPIIFVAISPFIGFSYSFIILGIIILASLIPILRLKDTN